MVSFQPAVKTRSAASGSFQMLASATGDTLPGSATVPPITMTSRSSTGNCGSIMSARLRLPSGPTATSVISPGYLRAMSTMNWADARGSGAPPRVRRAPRLPRPSAPWMWAGGASGALRQGVATPLVTGMSRPASAVRYSAFVVACSTLTLPKVVVMPTTSIAGWASAKYRAIASSTPGSVS